MSAATLIVTDESNLGSIEQQAARAAGFFDKGTMRLADSKPREQPPLGSFSVSSELANEIVRRSGRTLLQLRQAASRDSVFKPQELSGVTVTITTKVIREIKQSENVAGLLEGRDPKLKNEVVIFTAHYDHLGVGSDGVVYHGADDDGSGTATILELAEAFAKNQMKPKRSLLFITVAGEEKGLLGSEYYVHNPVLALNQTIANLNIDMVGRIDRKYEDLKNPNYVYVIGSDKISTELDSVLKVANRESEDLVLDYTYNNDSDPQQLYRRSDHFNFARNGVPIVFFFTGFHPDYHRPTDTVDKIMFDKMARIGRLVYYVGWKTANFPRQFQKNVKSSVYQ